MSKKKNKPATIKQMAVMKFEPVPQSDLDRMNRELERENWAKRTQDLRTTMVLAFAVLSKTKEELIEGMLGDEAVLDAMEHLVECCQTQAAWMEAAVQFCSSAECRILCAMAAASRSKAA
jgi:hypothetical protein